MLITHKYLGIFLAHFHMIYHIWCWFLRNTFVWLAGKVTAAELAETKAGDAIKSMEGLVNEAKAKLSITMKGK